MSAAPPAAPALSLRIERVTYADGTVGLRDIAFDIPAGEIVAIAGHVGAGKTTLALAAAGLLGRSVPARVEGRVSRAGAAPGVVLADPWTQLTELGGTVREEVAVGPENLALPRAEIAGRVQRALELADAAHLAERVPHELSGGELQRVALASALALALPARGDARGALLVLDEPTAQLDPAAGRALAARLRALAAEGVGILLVEQDLDLVAAVAERLVVLADGTMLAQGTPPVLLDRWPPLDARLGAPAAVALRHDPPPTRVEAGSDALLRVEGLVAGYGERPVLAGVSLEVGRGRVSAWLGANGAGKTTLARAIVGLVPARGTVWVDGARLDGLPVERRARSVGLVFQDPGRQLFARSVLAEAMAAPRAQGREAGDARQAAREALALVGLAGREGEHPRDLEPQGQRLLAIAAAMAARPPLLVLDEPTAGQDAAGRRAIARALEAQRGRGAAVVITHDVAFARRWCDEAMTIADGRAGGRVPAWTLVAEGDDGARRGGLPPA